MKLSPMHPSTRIQAAMISPFIGSAIVVISCDGVQQKCRNLQNQSGSGGEDITKTKIHRSFQGRKRPRGLESFARSLQLRVTRGTSLGHHEFLCESIRKY